MGAQLLKRLFTVDEFHRMGEAGVFGEEDRLELIDGEIISMTPIGPRHAACVNRLTALLLPQLGSAAILAPQNPVSLSEHLEPQPDVVLLRSRSDFYSTAHPGPRDLLLVVEVADSSIEYDRGIKVPRYARAGIPEVWLVDLTARLVEVYRRPAGGGYAEQVAIGPGGSLHLPGLGGPWIRVVDVLGGQEPR